MKVCSNCADMLQRLCYEVYETMFLNALKERMQFLKPERFFAWLNLVCESAE